jgi:hypothetical protein
MLLSRRDVLTNGVMGGALVGAPGGAALSPPEPEDEQVVQALRNIASEMQNARRSTLAGDLPFIGQLRDNMVQFLKSTNKWPDLIDVGPNVWFSVYDWHVRFNQLPVVTRLPDGHYGLTFMFTTMVLRQEQSRDYIGVAYDKDR